MDINMNILTAGIRNQLRKVLAKPRRHSEVLEFLRQEKTKILRDSEYDLVKVLLDERILFKQNIASKAGGHVTLYSSTPFKKLDPHDVAHAMFPDAYFCNLSSIYHNDLTNQIPRTIYLAIEETRKNDAIRKKPKKLPDAAIRRAFIKPARSTEEIYDFFGHDIVVTKRVARNETGVSDVSDKKRPCPTGSKVTSLERALIDAIVHPHYNGGLTSLPAYFENAKGRISDASVVQIYDKLGYTYPYWQSLGFMCDKIGLKSLAKKIAKGRTPLNRFYIDHLAKSTWVCDTKWQVYYPKDLL
jgi:predicted transcriptional regulator of viral defense system